MYIDIGANLTDPQFQGLYHGKKKHQEDLKDVIERAKQYHVKKIIITSGCLDDLRLALQYCEDLDPEGTLLFTTVGVHPTRCNELLDNPHAYINELIFLSLKYPKRVVAIGEIGLDFARLQFCDKETQIKYFDFQLNMLIPALGLPLFLHLREATDSFIETIKPYCGAASLKGVVHSFTGQQTDLDALLHLGLDIGINGCSLKTEETFQMLKTIPDNRLHLETDAPWCGIKSTHKSSNFMTTIFEEIKKPEKWQPGKLIKGRNEPCTIM